MEKLTEASVRVQAATRRVASRRTSVDLVRMLKGLRAAVRVSTIPRVRWYSVSYTHLTLPTILRV